MNVKKIELLEDIKRQWLSMIDAIDDPLVVIDENLQIIRNNKAYFQQSKTNTTQDITSFQGKKCFEIFAKRSSPCEHCQLKNVTKMDATAQWETDALFPEKSIQIKIKKIPHSENTSHFVVHYKDITQDKLVFNQLAQAEKLASIGKLAGGFAHEINTPLAAILAFTQIMLSETKKDSAFYGDLEQIEIAARKGKQIVEDLLKVARVGALPRQQHNTTPLDLYEQIRGILRLIQGFLVQNHITIKNNIPDAVQAFILGESNKIGQIFLNLLTNSIQAMPQGGSITLTAQKEEKRIRIVLEDTGEGISAEIINKIFDPFFTTKTIGQGIGLGLSIVYSLVKEHGGDIQVSSTVGEGTAFSITFPLYTQK